jgi:hypothetical protein
MNTSTVRDLAPHYIAMFILVLGVLATVRAAVGNLSFWIEFMVIAVIVFLYRPIVMQLGIGPSGWER